MSQDAVINRILGTRAFVDDLLYVADEDQCYVWREGVYEPLDYRFELPRMLTRFLIQEKNTTSFPASTEPVDADVAPLPLHPDFNINTALIQSITKQLPWMLPDDRVLTQVSASRLTFSDGIQVDLDDPTLARTMATRSSPSFFKVPFPSTILDGSFDPSQSCPRFMQFLDEVLVVSRSNVTPDIELQHFMQDIFGYLIMDTVRAHACFFFTGDGGNGKSVMLNVIRQLFPPFAVSSVKISDIAGSSFKLASLIGKKINIVHEEESKDMRLDVLKSIISGDQMLVERKFRDPVEIVPKVKFLCGTNDVPTFPHLDGGLRRRINVVPFHNAIPLAQRDTSLIEKLKEEQAGIFRFAIEGAKRMRERSYTFQVPASVTATFEIMAEERYPALRFLKQFYDITGDPDDKIANITMYKTYQDWSRDNGYKALNENNFGKQLLGSSSSITSGSSIYIIDNGKRYYAKAGLKAKADVAPPNAAKLPFDHRF